MLSISKRFIPERFSFKTAIKLRAYSLLKSWINIGFTECYSQLGEDIAIKHIMNTFGVKKGSYVDVGCNHPQRGSNSFGLYSQQWQGITIDLNKDLISLHQVERKKDIQVHTAVSDMVKEVTVYEFEEVHAINTIEESAYIENKDKYKPKSQFNTIKTQTLNQILIDNNVSKIDLLLIDVEGHDLHVLKSIDLNEYRPKLIVVEFFIKDLTKAEDNEIVMYLKSMGYIMRGYLIVNGYFIDGNVSNSPPLP